MKKKLLFLFIFFVIVSSSTNEYANYSDDDMTLFFTSPLKYSFGNNPIEKAIISLINSAQSTVNICAFDFDNANLLTALQKADDRGVHIKIIADENNTPKKILGYYVKRNWLIPYNAKRLMHLKLIIIDHFIAITGSMNFTINCMYLNNNDCYLIKNKELVFALEKYFHYMTGNKDESILHKAVNSKTISLYFTSSDYYDVNTIIKEKLLQAKERIVFAYSTFTNPEIAQMILDISSKSKIKCFGLLEKQNTYSDYSVYSFLSDNNFKIFYDTNDFLMHHKYILIDNTLITGSYAIASRTTKKNDYNDDIIIVIDNPHICDIYYKYTLKLISGGNFQ